MRAVLVVRFLLLFDLLLFFFLCSDTMPACFYVQHHLNGGKPAGSSVPASEHSVMTSFPHERAAFAHMIEKFELESFWFFCFDLFRLGTAAVSSRW